MFPPFCYKVFKAVFYIILKLYNRIEIRHADRVPEKGGVIVVANHASYFDPPAIGVSVRRKATFMAKESLFRRPFLIGRFVSSFALPVRRGRPRPSTIKDVVERLKRGELIIMFPQGGRNAGVENLDIKRGVDLIARLSGAVIVPALLEGTDRALPVGAILPRPAKIRVSFGHPIEAGDSDDLTGLVSPSAGLVAEAFRILKEETKN